MSKNSIPEKAAIERCGINLRNLRNRHRLTAKQVGESLGLTTDAILKYERGNRQPSTLTLILLSYLYGVSIDRIIFGVDHTIEHVNFADPNQLKNIVVIRDDEGRVTYIGPDRRQSKMSKFKGRDRRSKVK